MCFTARYVCSDDNDVGAWSLEHKRLIADAFLVRLDSFRGGVDKGRGGQEEGRIIRRSPKAQEGKEGQARRRKSEGTGSQ